MPQSEQHVVSGNASRTGQSPTLASAGTNAPSSVPSSVRPPQLTMQSVQEQKGIFKSLPAQYQQMIEQHPLVTQEGFAPHALAQGILGDQRRFGGLDEAFRNFMMNSGQLGSPVSGQLSAPRASSIPQVTAMRSQMATGR